MTTSAGKFTGLLDTLGEPLLVRRLVSDLELAKGVLGELLGVALPGNLGGGDGHSERGRVL